MKKLAVVLLVLVVAAIGTLLVLPSFWDWNAEKGRIAALVKEHTGRDLQIAGDVSLRLLPRPAFAAEQVTLANLDGGSEPAMVRLEELTISIAALPLLRGEVQVQSVTLVKPEVLLEVLADGRANWQFGKALPADGAAEPAAPPRPAASAQPIRVDSFLVEDGRVRFRDARSGRQETLEGLDAEFAAGSLAGPFAAVGTATYRGVPLAFDANLGQLVEGGATATSLSLQLPQAGASATFIGALSRHAELRTLRGRLQAEGRDLAEVMRALARGHGTGGAPALAARPFTLAAEISASDSEAAADSLELTLGPLSFDGRIAGDFGDVPKITARLAATTVDLDALLAPAAGQAQPPAEGAVRPPAAGAAPSVPVTLPQGFSASLELTAEALLYRGQALRQLRVAGRLEDGRLEVTEAAVQLPGSSDISLSGRITTTVDGPHFTGHVAAESNNLRGLLRWLGSNPEQVPAERLRRLALKTDLEASGDQLVLRDADLRLDVSRLTGGAAIALRERPGLGIALNIDKLNLDAYLPPADQVDSAAPSQAPGQSQSSEARPATPAAAPDPLAVPLLGRFDANLDLRIGQLTYQGLPLNGVQLDATLQQSGLVVRELSVADVVGSRGSFSGSVASVDRNPSIDGSIDLSVATLSRLMKALGLSAGGPPPLESFTLSGAVNGNSEELRFDQRLAALGGTLRASGRADLRPGAPQVSATLELDHPDLSVLLGELLRDPGVPAGLGPAALRGRLDAGGGSASLAALTGKLAGIELLDGRLAVATAGPRPKVTADITAGAMPLAALMAPAASTRAAGGGNGVRSTTGSARERWSRKPLDLAALRAVDAEVRLTAKSLQTDKLQLANAVLEAQLADGLLELRRFTADGYGGALSVTGRADARDEALGLQLSGALNADKVELKGLLRDLADSERFSGPVTLESRLSTRGSSEAALVSALAGDGKLTGTVTVAAKVEEQAGALVLDMLGQKVREVRGITDSTTMLFGAFAGAPATVDGTFKVEEGVARSNDLTVRGRDAVARTEGTVDLPDWRLDSVTNVYRDADLQNAYLTAKLRGPLDEPNVALGGQPFQRQQAPAGQPVPDGGEPPAVTQQPQLQPLKPEELLKDGLKNLLKGLGG